MRQLLALPDNAARAAQCRGWAQEASLRWEQGQRECVLDLLASNDIRYRRMDEQARTAIAKQKWTTSPTARSLANDDQMFSRWAIMYGVAP
jgi:hypothetical protein